MQDDPFKDAGGEEQYNHATGTHKDDDTPLTESLPYILRSYARAKRLIIGPKKRDILNMAADFIEGKRQ